MEKGYKLCPYCGEEIKKIAKKCRFCGEFLIAGNEKDLKKGKHKEKSNMVESDKKRKIKIEKTLTYEETEKDLGITIGDDFFENTSKNNLLFGAIMLIIVVIACIKNGGPKSGEERVGLIIGLLIVGAFISTYISRKRAYFIFKKKGISAHIQKPLYTILPIFRDIEIKYEDIDSISLKYTGGRPILFIAFCVFYGTEYLAGIDVNTRFFVFLIEIAIFVLPFFLWRKKYCKMIIHLKNGTDIKTSVIKGTKKQVFDILENYFENSGIKNVSLLYYT